MNTKLTLQQRSSSKHGLERKGKRHKSQGRAERLWDAFRDPIKELDNEVEEHGIGIKARWPGHKGPRLGQ